ncbi:cobaltochelatase subunit CobN [Kerstersia sp.]|uniref:cobaltochelatase subunit CobN n=1 Tax=Kerstersia sp. TaxID=1930783 RepID=UPI003F92AF76
MMDAEKTGFSFCRRARVFLRGGLVGGLMGGLVVGLLFAATMMGPAALAASPSVEAGANNVQAVQGEAQAPLPVLRVFTNSFVPKGKFERLQGLAEAAGMQLEHVNVAHAPGMAGAWLNGAALAVLDTPRPADRTQVEAALGAALRQPDSHWLAVGGGAPAQAGLDAVVARRLAAYYEAGGTRNFQLFFRYAQAALSGGDLALFPDPEPLPASGFYHPASTRIFPALSDYLAWGQTRWQAGSGVVAFLTHAGALGDLQTDDLDVLVSKAEAAGLIPVVFWFDAQHQTLPELLGQGQVDALVNLGHLQDGKARSADFLALDIPVLQTATFRQEPGEPDWEHAVSGMPPRTLAIFLAGPEGWGMMDPIVLRQSVQGAQQLLPEQADALIGKLQGLVALRQVAAADKKLALLFWNYPQGEKNLAASHLNLPRSIVSLAHGLAEHGYRVTVPEEIELIRQAQEMLAALYRQEALETLLQHDLADVYPVQAYRQWLRRLPAAQRQALAHWGDPGKHWAVREIGGEAVFVIPRLQLGHLTVLPQMPRAAEMGQHYHDTASAPDHLYLAAYLYLRQKLGVHALIHMGTHGTQEWLPGKDRGLAATDFPFLAVGDVPVFYPYLQDNVGEAMQAKRRGRAVTISHQTPPFAPAGLYDTLADLHQLIHEYQQLDEGAAQSVARDRILAAAQANHMLADLGWETEDARLRFEDFVQALHDHLHELARAAMPLGLHTFGEPAAPEHRLMTVMQQLGEPFYQAAGMTDDEWLTQGHAAAQWMPGTAPEALQAQAALDAGAAGQEPPLAAGADSAATLQQSRPYRLLQTSLRSAADGQADAQDGETMTMASLSPALRAQMERARQLDAGLADTQEIEALLAGLAGRFVLPGAGGDPLRNPDIASGRNLYAFEADRIPSPAAYEAGQAAYAQLLQAYADSHDGAVPRKLAFSLWSSEAIRHLGVTEAQVLHALGLRPVWGRGGRVEALEIIPASELGRPRVDVVVQVTGVYRDQFDGFMRLLAEAIERLAQLEEPDNAVAANTLLAERMLRDAGIAPAEAQQGARQRIFGNAPGAYGTGVPHLTLQADAWEDEAALSAQFLNSSQYAYGATAWGENRSGKKVLETQLSGVQAVVMSRSSHLHGVLSTDHPFEFMGGLSAAIRHLDGSAPALLVSDLRQGQPRTTSLQRFLSDEMRVRYLNPAWIQGMQAEGYAGTLSVLEATNNLYGWQAMDASTVRADQWQAMFDTYVADTRELGMQAWFERDNPHAQGQMLERMAEAVRRGYWDAPPETRQKMAQRWQELQRDFQVKAGAAVTRAYLDAMVAGYGLQNGAAAPDAMTAPPASQADAPEAPEGFEAPAQPAHDAPASSRPLENVAGQELLRHQDDAPGEDDPWRHIGLALLLVLLLAAGAGQYWRGNQRAVLLAGSGLAPGSKPVFSGKTKGSGSK